MSREQQELLDEAYENWLMNTKKMVDKEILKKFIQHTPNIHKEEFINKIKTDDEFANKWGLRIEERELSTKERVDIFNLKMIKEGIRTQIATVGVVESYWKKSLEETRHNIPTKLITITYNDKPIESYG